MAPNHGIVDSDSCRRFCSRLHGRLTGRIEHDPAGLQVVLEIALSVAFWGAILVGDDYFFSGLHAQPVYCPQALVDVLRGSVGPVRPIHSGPVQPNDRVSAESSRSNRQICELTSLPLSVSLPLAKAR